jgi:predicted P-type ATPase
LANSHLHKFCESNVNGERITFLEFKLFKYIYDPITESFSSHAFGIKTTHENLNKHFLNGLTKDEMEYQKKLFGFCDLDIEVEGVFSLLLKEVLDPFYIFQVFSVTLWFYNSYTNYAAVIVATTVIFLALSVYETRKNLVSVKNMAKYTCSVNVYRQNAGGTKDEISISSRDLVPGDLFEVPEDGLALPCDAILVGGSVIVNEAMLTGESTPIVKKSISKNADMFIPSIDNQNMLFAGTKIIQKRNMNDQKVLALVESIGFNTQKGNLIRSILFSAEVESKFKKDSIRYILFMACLSVIGFLTSLPFMILHGIEFREIIVRGLDLVTTTVPPALPACLGIGISYAISRLKSWGIVCVNRRRVNVAGTVDLVCFDKTGTLTEDHLDIYGFRPVKLSHGLFMFDNYCTNVDSHAEESKKFYKEKTLDNNTDKTKEIKNLFMECLASCHTITKVDGKLVGDPIDVKMFNACGWSFNENLENLENFDPLISSYLRPPGEKDLKEKLSCINDIEDEEIILKSHYELGVVKQFEFSSKLQRMSVLTKNVNEPFFKVFCKGSPEKIKELCNPSTIPANFNDILNNYTTKGLRVLGLATKSIKMDYIQSQKISRERVESNMTFLGLLIVQNKLKAESAPSIEILHNANIKMVMATGDNILTAISVSKECLLIKNDIPIWTYEVIKEGKTDTLTWNVVETFKDDEECDLISMRRESQDYDYTRHFRAETFYDNTRESKLMVNKAQEVKIIEDDETDILNIDVTRSPTQMNQDDNFVIAISGATFERLLKLKNKYITTRDEKLKIYNDTFKLVIKHGYIFARMSPDHKTLLVEAMKDEKFVVCMCGDGANDCGALRAADVGVSLSIEEASIAAPFTSNKANISCLIKLFREGKNSLVSSIQTFKYMMIYSLIQFISVFLLTVYNSLLTDNQFLVSDLFITFPLAMFIARTGAYGKLTHHKPTGALISMPIISSIIIQVIIQSLSQFGSALMVQSQNWYSNDCFVEDKDVNPCYDNTVYIF